LNVIIKEDMMNKNLLKAIKKVADCQVIKLIIQGKQKDCIQVDTDYLGPYAPAETFDIKNNVDKILKRYPKYKAEWRGHYTSIFIY